MRQLVDVRGEHAKAVNKYGFEWIEDPHPKCCSLYGGQVFERPQGFRMYDETKKGVNPATSTHYRVGDHVIVHVKSWDNEGKGEVYAPSIARILAIFQDSKGCCHVALHYYWRWGQIHADADLHSATRPKHRAQIFLQKEITGKTVCFDGETSNNAVKFADGSYKETIPAVYINHWVLVLSRQEAEASYARPGVNGLDVFEDSFKDSIDEDSGTRDNGFWYQYTFDHTMYTFETIPEAVSTLNNQLQPPERPLLMGDVFCGLGTMGLAANSIGFQIEFGIDQHPSHISSFKSNTMNYNGVCINAITRRQPKAILDSVQAVVARELAARAAGQPCELANVQYLHGSPPCQNISNKKKLRDREFKGEEFRSFIKLVELMQPDFVTLEEVPGLLAQRFLPHNMQGVLSGWPHESNTQQDQNPQLSGTDRRFTMTEAEAAAEDDDQEGEGSDDVDDQVPGLLETQAAAQAAAGTGSEASASMVFNPCLLLVPQLLDSGYQVRMSILQAADAGVPQIRWRVFLFAAKHGCKLPQPPVPSYKCPPEVTRPRLVADPRFLVKEGKPGDWFETLQVLPAAGVKLLPHTTLQEAIGDLPALMTLQYHQQQQHDQQQKQQQGVLSTSYQPEQGVMNCVLPEPVQDLRPVSRYSQHMRAPHNEAQRQRVCQWDKLTCHVVTQKQNVDALLRISEKAPEGHLESKAQHDKRMRVGKRPTANGLAACVLGHNEPRRTCLHFLEDRMMTARERARLQSIPDWVQIDFLAIKEFEQQVGNAVPYLLGQEVAAAVWEAATGQPAQRPPCLYTLAGPCTHGTGIADKADRATYEQWVQQQPDWGQVIADIRTLLHDKAQQIQLQQQARDAQLRAGGSTQQQQQQPLPSAVTSSQAAGTAGLQHIEQQPVRSVSHLQQGNQLRMPADSGIALQNRQNANRWSADQLDFPGQQMSDATISLRQQEQQQPQLAAAAAAATDHQQQTLSSSCLPYPTGPSVSCQHGYSKAYDKASGRHKSATLGICKAADSRGNSTPGGSSSKRQRALKGPDPEHHIGWHL